MIGINLAGICDIQLMEFATRSFSKGCVNGLTKCIERDLKMTRKEKQDWLAIKKTGVKLFAPEYGEAMRCSTFVRCLKPYYNTASKIPSISPDYGSIIHSNSCPDGTCV